MLVRTVMSLPYFSILGLAGLLAGLVPVAAALPGGEDPVDRLYPRVLYPRVRAAAVEVLVDRRLSGSGWLAAEPGYAFTASHVVPDRKAAVAVRLADGRVIGATVKARDAGHDGALLELAERQNLPAGLPLAAKPGAPGEPIYLLGSPIFRHAVFLPGRVAREGTTFEWMGSQRDAVECVHVAASTPKGVSGGPWVNLSGEVVGVQSGLIEQGNAPAGIGWFGPAADLARLLATKADAPLATLGVAFEELEEQSVERIREFPAAARGIILKLIVKGGPAESAKLPAGCLAVAIDGECPTTRDAAYRLIRSRPAGKPVQVRYFEPKGTAEKSVEVAIGAWQEAP
jgi:S1-C subfamily serine protease